MVMVNVDIIAAIRQIGGSSWLHWSNSGSCL